jgi:hypothetical protein
LGCANFHNAENVIEPLWRALCSGILISVVTLRLKRGICVEAGSRSRAQADRDLRQRRLARRRVHHLAASRGARDQGRRDSRGNRKRCRRAKLTLGIPAPMTAEQAALRAGARRRGVQKNFYH